MHDPDSEAKRVRLMAGEFFDSWHGKLAADVEAANEAHERTEAALRELCRNLRRTIVGGAKDELRAELVLVTADVRAELTRLGLWRDPEPLSPTSY